MFLILSAVILVVLLNVSSDNTTSGVFQQQLKEVKQEVQTSLGRSVSYLENKLNKLAETQDIYQASTSRRVEVLENKIKVLEKENKDLKVFKRDSTVLINNNVQQNNNK
jgi:cell shape-determining protein MreC